MAAYGVDVLDPHTSVRRLRVLLDHMPPPGRQGGQVWSVEAELLAGLVDHVANLTWVTLRAHGAKNAPRPKPLPRPPHRGTPPPRQAPAAPQPSDGQTAPRKTASWAEAFNDLAGNAGVQVRRHDGLRRA